MKKNRVCCCNNTVVQVVQVVDRCFNYERGNKPNAARSDQLHIGRYGPYLRTDHEVTDSDMIVVQTYDSVVEVPKSDSVVEAPKFFKFIFEDG